MTIHPQDSLNVERAKVRWNSTRTGRIFLILVSIAFLLALPSRDIDAGETVGLVRTVSGAVFAVLPESQRRSLMRNAEVFLNDQISTGPRSFVVISFSDDSLVTVRPNSEFAVEEYLFDDDNKKATLNLTRGGLRIITGRISKQNPENYRLTTPVASMGVRGTRFDARLCEEDCASEERLITTSE